MPHFTNLDLQEVLLPQPRILYAWTCSPLTSSSPLSSLSVIQAVMPAPSGHSVPNPVVGLRVQSLSWPREKHTSVTCEKPELADEVQDVTK